MSWLIKTDKDKFEVWTDNEYSMMKQKCEYYGAKPHWTEIRQLENQVTSSELSWTPHTNSNVIKKLLIA